MVVEVHFSSSSLRMIGVLCSTGISRLGHMSSLAIFYMLCKIVLCASFWSLMFCFGMQSALNIGSATHIAGSGQPFPSSSAMAPPPGPASASSPAVSTLQIPSPPLAAPTPLGSLLDINDPGSNKNRATNLVKPSFFIPPPSSSAAIVPPVSSSMPTAPPLHPPVNLQRPYGAPILQPFPPPTPPPSLTPAPVPTANYAPVVNRDKIRDALSVLVQVSLPVVPFVDFYRKLYHLNGFLISPGSCTVK